MYKRYLNTRVKANTAKTYDVIVVGGGVAGIYAALSIPSKRKVLLIAKGGLRECNSNLAQGGIAMTLDEDYESHVQDTLKAGSFYNDAQVVEAMIKMSQEVYEDLTAFGTDFDKYSDGRVSMTAEGGHTKRRIVHCKDMTGAGVMTALMAELEKRSNIEVLENVMGIDLLSDYSGGPVNGLRVLQLEDNQVIDYNSKAVVIATGGIGALFSATTNAKTISGDGIAMALRAGAELRDMEFIQYHPTAMALHKGGYFLISEAVRGEGGKLINELGQRFMDGKHEMRELAPRDVVAKAISDEQQNGHQVYVDVRHFEDQKFKTRFPNIYEACLENGIDPEKQPIPVTPVEHYFMGGIKADACGRTNIKGLYVTGEASSSGFHGANRLASNSLLECLAMSKKIGQVIIESFSDDVMQGGGTLDRLDVKGADSKGMEENVHLDTTGGVVSMDIQGSEEALKEAMYEFTNVFSGVFGIIKHRNKIKDAIDFFEKRLEWCNQFKGSSVIYYNLYNGLMLGREIGLGAVNRDKSLGGFIVEED